MAKDNKIHLPLWQRYLKIFRAVGLNDTQLGEMVRTMMEYRFEGKEPEELSEPVRILWTILQSDVDAAVERYDAAVESGRKGGIRSGALRKQLQDEQQEDENSTENNHPRQPWQADGEGVYAPSKRKYGEYGWVLLDQQEFDDLERRMGLTTLGNCIAYIDRYAQCNGNRHGWKDWYVVLRRCYEEGWYRPIKKEPKDDYSVPMGATGELGEAELEAIRQVLEMDP